MIVKVKYQTMEQNEENQPVMVIKEDVIETKNFNLKEAVDVLTGQKRDEHGNNIQGIMVGEKNYYRAIDVTNISVE
ncbi:hypothetical protein ABQD64_05245 [Vagococcus fluvialis]|uniref:hypothetical protein n=1 Tax=Vagococcus fluvialis TaxID=2738 RepID=UPI0032E3F363